MKWLEKTGVYISLPLTLDRFNSLTLYAAGNDSFRQCGVQGAGSLSGEGFFLAVD